MSDASAARILRNALVRTSKTHDFARGACGHYKVCGSHWVDGRVAFLSRKSGIDPMCAFFTDKKVEPVGLIDPEETMADLLEVSRDWVISFLTGWDGGTHASVPKAFRLGKKLASEFVEG